MDYGKLAYLKADELENRLNNSLKATERSVCTEYTVSPVFDFKSGEYSVSDIRADGSVTLFMRMTVCADSDITNGEIAVLINGLAAGKSTFGLSTGEKTELFIMCAVYVSGVAAVSLSSGADCTLLCCQLLISGADAEISGRGGDSAVDIFKDKWALVTSSDDYVNAYLFTEDDFKLENPKYIGTGRHADVAAGKDGFCIAYVDTAANVFIAMTDGELNVLFGRFVDSGAERVAVSAYGAGFVLAELSQGKITVRYVDANGGTSEPSLVDVTGAAERIGFVKSAERPELIVYADGRSYLKCAAVEHGGADTVNVSADIFLEGVN